VRTVSQDAAFTPYYALTERDRGRLAYVAKIDLEGEAARELPTGLPLEAALVPTETAAVSEP
jgi:HlyD family secretion protein